MRRWILWIAALLITFAVGIGADRLWWHFLTAPPSQPAKVEPIAFDVAIPTREVVPAYVPPPPPPAALAPPKPNLILDYDSDMFSVWASFYIMGSKPKEFADIDSIEAMLTPESAQYPGTISVYTHKGDDYDSAAANFALVTEKRFFFATGKLGGKDFEYRFDGEFVRTDFDAVEGKNKAVLRGTLTKTKNGRTIAQHEFSFRMEYMGC